MKTKPFFSASDQLSALALVVAAKNYE